MPLLPADADLLTDSLLHADATSALVAGATFAGGATLSCDGEVFTFLTGQDGGTSSTSSPTPVLLMLMSGHDGGFATVLENLDFNLSASTSGQATVSGASLFEFVYLTGSDSGTSTATDSVPLPIYGLSGSAAFLEITIIPTPVRCDPRPVTPGSEVWCKRSFNLFRYPPFPKPGEPWPLEHSPLFPFTNSPTGQVGDFGQHRDDCNCDRWDRNPCVPKQFRWGHFFTYGDLMLYVRDLSGNPMSPYSVTYTMYQVAPSGAVMQAGPAGKPAVMQNVGVYYAVGTAGENGQPGGWLVRWSLQRSFGGATSTGDCPFTVVDSVSSPIPGDPTCRQQKYGWD